MSSTVQLHTENHKQDAEFSRALHGKSVVAHTGLAALRNKNKEAQKATVDDYFKHWDRINAADETDETRKASWFLLLFRCPQSVWGKPRVFHGVGRGVELTFEEYRLVAMNMLI